MSFHDQNYNEKRDFIRMKVETEATLTLTASGEQVAVVCQDLSSQGVQLVLDKPLAEGTAVQLSIPSPTEHLQGLQAAGQVMRCIAEDNGLYAVGIHFDRLE
ncbi:MAG: PilZ domain-containing protein [Pseudoalteromonas distincta]